MKRAQGLIVALLLCAGPLQAQEPGDKIFVKADSAELKVGKKVVGSVARGQSLEVLRTNGDWIWVKHQVGQRVVNGWVHRNQIQTSPLPAARPAPTATGKTATTAGAGSGGTLRIGTKTHALKHVLAYRTRFMEDDPNLFTVVLATAKPISATDLRKLRESLEKKGDDSGLHVWDAQLKLVFDPDGGLMQFHGWADNVSLNGGSDVEAVIENKAGNVRGKAVVTEAKKLFDLTYQFNIAFDVKLTSFNVAGSTPAAVANSNNTPSRAAQGTGVTPKPERRKFSAQAMHLPFPPDARELEFDATFKDVEFVSASPLASLADFYRQYMTAREWEEDKKEASMEDDEIELTFAHGESKVVVELTKNSDGEVDVDLDCEELTWEGIHNPVGLVAAGVPQPRALLFLQKDVPRPEGANSLEFEDDQCQFKSALAAKEAANYYMAELQRRGWKASRSRPFLTDNLCKLQYKQGPGTLNITIFRNPSPAGSRITIGYENESPVAVVPPLGTIASVASPSASSAGATKPSPQPQAAPFDFSTTKGSATVTFGGKKYVFKNAVAFQTKAYGDDRVVVKFSNRPIPFDKMQKRINTDEDFSFHDLYEYSSPDTFGLFLYKGGMPLSFSVSGTGIGGHQSDYGVHDAEVKDGRIAGTFKMTQSEEILSRQFQFAATVDAPILRPSSWPALESLPLHNEKLVDQGGVLLPDNATDMEASGTKDRPKATATVPMTLPQVMALYREDLEEANWQEDEEARVSTIGKYTIVFHRGGKTLKVTLVRDDPQTQLTVSLDSADKAK